MKRLLQLCSISFLLLPAFCQNEPAMEDMDALLFMDVPVVTSTLTEKKLSEAPSNMTVISSSEIQAMGSQNLLDILEKAGGIIVTRNNFGLYLISMRGIATKNGNDKIKLLLNGHTIAEPLRSSYTYFFNIAADNIKQVEILRGPGSCLYGTNAFSGIINVITKNSASDKGSSISLRGGSNDTWRTNYNLSGTPSEEQEFNFNADYSKTDGPDLTLEKDALSGNPFSAAPGKMNEKSEEKRVYGDYRFKNFSIMGSYSDTDLGVPVGENYMTQDQENRSTQFGFLEAKYDLTFSENSVLSFKTSLDMVDTLTKGQYYPEGFILSGDSNNDGTSEPLDTNHDGQIEYFPDGAYGELGYKTREYRTELLWKYAVSDNNQLLLGTFYEKVSFYDFTLKSDFHPLYLYRLDHYTDFSKSIDWLAKKDREIGGAFFQDEWTLSESYYLVLGGRYDEYSDFGSTFNPRAGLVWDLADKTHIKLMYGTAFKAPTFSQLYTIDNPLVVGNPDLDPEKLESMDLNVCHVFRDKLHASLTLFKTNIENLIDVSQEPDMTIPGHPLYYINYSETEIYGAEAEMRYFFSESDYTRLGYQYTHGKDKDNHTEYLPFIPRHQANAGLNLRLLEKLSWNVECKYVGSMPREKNDPRSDLKAYATTDTTFIYKVMEKVSLSFSVYNLFDQEERFSPSLLGDYPQSDLPQTGRTYSLRTKFSF